MISASRVPITPGEEIFAGNGMRFHVLEVVAFEDEAEPFVVLSPFVGLLQVEASVRKGRSGEPNTSSHTSQVPRSW